MVKLGCTIDGNLNDSKFSQPMPWIGIYIAAASALCAIAMAVDALYGFRHRKYWFPCKFFSLNATTLTLIGVTIKLSVDLNTSMPRPRDQLVKLSSSTLICTVMGNSMPSLGTTENKEIFMNIMALGILVITAIVNICIELGTGVIYVYWKEHAFLMFLMLVLLASLTSSALIVPTTKHYFDLKYTKKLKMAMEECYKRTGKKSVVEKLKGDLTKFWMMANTCAPQFVIGRSATCTASGAFCLLAAMTLTQAILRTYFIPRSFKFCSGESEYKWSITLIFVTQVIAVVAGTIAPALRWFNAINFKCPRKASMPAKRSSNLEWYWISRLVEWKESPLELEMSGRLCKKIVHDTKKLVLGFCIQVQTGIVMVSKWVMLVSIFFMSFLRLCYYYCAELKKLLKIKCNNSLGDNDSGSGSLPGPELDLSRFVLHLEGEEELVDVMMENNKNITEYWYLMGKRKQPENLIQLVEKSTSRQVLNGVSEFDNDEVPSLEAEEPPNSWALPVVTLTAIAVALPGIERHLVKQLIRSVCEGLAYVKVVENNLNDKKEFKNVSKAAETLWLEIHVYGKWLDVDLHKISLQAKGPEKVLKEFADIAKNRFFEFHKNGSLQCLRESPSKWSIKMVAANIMYRISQTILLDYEARDYDGSERLFERLIVMIADILSACLTNLPRAMLMECHQSTIEEREENVRRTIILLGKAERILELLGQLQLPSLDLEQLAYIDDWRSLRKQKASGHLDSSSTITGKPCSGSFHMYLTIE
ncbi:uncharacterized protein LOC127787462 [Diospyros lotus]|uniref:uncharacterized protein LOC127787462 n=1 Tax=Diospyros lotus TaxID=55363 RepID=UPI00225A7756|nr:uncharacterized protein LOC127787462 [Diospyros lotus]